MLPRHVVVAGERRAHQVLAAVLHPLHRLAGDDRADDGEHVAGVDADLVAEAAADVRRDDLDLVLRDAGDQRVDRAVRVRRLVGRVDGQLAGHRVHRRDGAAGLHRRGMHAGVEHLLRRRRPRRRRTPRSVSAASPDSQSKMWLSVLPSMSSRMTGASGSSARLASTTGGQRLVVDLDQLQRVPGDVLGVGDDERDLLVLEAHLVGGQHRLHVRRQRRHPGQAQVGERLRR